MRSPSKQPPRQRAGGIHRRVFDRRPVPTRPPGAQSISQRQAKSCCPAHLSLSQGDGGSLCRPALPGHEDSDQPVNPPRRGWYSSAPGINRRAFDRSPSGAEHGPPARPASLRAPRGGSSCYRPESPGARGLCDPRPRGRVHQRSTNSSTCSRPEAVTVEGDKMTNLHNDKPTHPQIDQSTNRHNDKSTK